MKTLIIISAILLSVFNSKAATCVSLGNGDWANPATWSCGAVPTAGDSVVIAFGHTVTITTTEILSGAPFILVVQGVFLFDKAGAKLHLPCGSMIYVEPTGSILSSGVGMPSHNIKICDKLIWEGADGVITGPIILTGPTPLPVEFIGSELKNFGGSWMLVWQVASEQNNDYFQIEYSLDAISWEVIGEVSSLGNHNELTDYNFDLGRLHPGDNFVRLSQKDKNGELEHLQVLSTKLEANIEVYPNPANNNSKVTVDLSEINKEAKIFITSVDGRILETMEYNPVSSPDLIQISTSNLNSGTYIIIVSSTNNSRSIPLVIR